MSDEFYWRMRGALCLERIEQSWAKGFDTCADAERELIHVEHMLGGDWPLQPYMRQERNEGESTRDWMSRAEALMEAEADELMGGMTEQEIEDLLNEYAA